jgi:RNA polymerase sigma-70 factor (ECF subfamily)
MVESPYPGEHMTEDRRPVETSETAPVPAEDWAQLVEKIQSGEPGGLEALYRLFGRGVRYYLYRQLGPQDLDDRVHDAFLVVVQTIQRGELRDPARLMGFVRTILRRQVATRIDELVHVRREHVAIEHGPVITDRTDTPEQRAIGDQKVQLMLQVLKELPPRDREILTRFYLNEESQEQICREMNLNDTQFRLIKSRAKARFGELGRRTLSGTLRRFGLKKK